MVTQLMEPALTHLETFLWDHLDALAGGAPNKLSTDDAARVRRVIADTLKIADPPISADPLAVVEFIVWNCGDELRDAVEHWLGSLTQDQLQKVDLCEVLEALRPIGKIARPPNEN